MPTLYVVATPIGNLSDMSPRAKETLSSVSLIAAEDTTHTIKLLNSFDIKTPMISYHKYNEAEKAPYIIEKMSNEAIDVAIVTDAGTPCISDPGYDLIALARKNGIKVIGIPGPSAAVTALSISGFPVDTFTFIGFLERDERTQREQLQTINESPMDNIVIYESPFRLIGTLKVIADVIDCDVCVCNDLTKLHETTYTGEINDVIDTLSANANVEKGEYVIIIHKHKKEIIADESEEKISTEALLVDLMVKKGCTMKEAVSELHRQMPDVAKKEIYGASLRLKELFGE